MIRMQHGDDSKNKDGDDIFILHVLFLPIMTQICFTNLCLRHSTRETNTNYGYNTNCMKENLEFINEQKVSSNHLWMGHGC